MDDGQRKRQEARTRADQARIGRGRVSECDRHSTLALYRGCKVFGMQGSPFVRDCRRREGMKGSCNEDICESRWLKKGIKSGRYYGKRLCRASVCSQYSRNPRDRQIIMRGLCPHNPQRGAPLRLLEALIRWIVSNFPLCQKWPLQCRTD